MWVLLANWVISGSDTLSVFEENIFKIKLEETTGLAASHGIEKLAVIRNLLVIGGVEENPGPKLNLYRLLRQIERSEDEMEFLMGALEEAGPTSPALKQECFIFWKINTK